MDGSTDKGRVENELFVILFCKKKIHCERYRPVPGIVAYWSQERLMRMGWWNVLVQP